MNFAFSSKYKCTLHSKTNVNLPLRNSPRIKKKSVSQSIPVFFGILVTRIKFNDRFRKGFERTIKAYLEQNSLILKDVSTLNNANGIQEEIPQQIDFTKVIFLASKTTSLTLIQPKVRLIIENFKILYSRELLSDASKYVGLLT